VIAEVLGWTGAGALLLGYALISTRRLDAAGRAYQLLNLGGSLGLAVNGAVNGAWPSTALNLLWAAIGVTALARLARRRRRSGRPGPG